MPQPFGEPFDLVASDAEIPRATEVRYRQNPGFTPRATREEGQMGKLSG